MTVIKRPAKKIAVPKKEAPTTDPNRETDKDETTKILAEKKPKVERAGKIAKVVSFHFSVGDEDRNRTMEEFVEQILKLVKPTKYGTPGIHATKMSEYYILDGVVCLTADYDEKKQAFKPGTYPPAWAGGPVPVHKAPKPLVFDNGRKVLSAAQYDAKYGRGGNPAVIKPKPVDDLLPEFDWDESTVDDEAAAKGVADDTITKAKRTLRIKKTAPAAEPAPAKRVIRRKAK